MTYFKLDGSFYKVMRETPKTLFYKWVKPNKVFTGCNETWDTLEVSTKYEYYDIDNLNLGKGDLKIHKSKVKPCDMVTSEYLHNTLFIDEKRIQVTDDLKLNHAFFIDDNMKFFKQTYDIRNMVYNLTSMELKTQIENGNIYATDIYNRVLQHLNTFISSLGYDLNDKKQMMSSTLALIGNTDFENRLAEALLLEPIHIETPIDWSKKLFGGTKYT
jgi:hypothetical protein